MLLNLAMQYNITIVQKYLEVGHTQMNSVHSAIERKLKNLWIHLPSDYLSPTLEADKNLFRTKLHLLIMILLRTMQIRQLVDIVQLGPGESQETRR